MGIAVRIIYLRRRGIKLSLTCKVGVVCEKQVHYQRTCQKYYFPSRIKCNGPLSMRDRTIWRMTRFGVVDSRTAIDCRHCSRGDIFRKPTSFFPRTMRRSCRGGGFADAPCTFQSIFRIERAVENGHR